MKRIYLVALSALLVAGCSKFDNNSVQKSESPIFTANFADESTNTKVYADDKLELHWDANDEITVFNGTKTNEQYRFTGAQGAKTGDFEKVSETTTERSLTRNFAFYPYNSNIAYDNMANGFNRGIVGFYVSIPAVQKYAQNSFCKESNLMAAVTTSLEDFNLTFKNIGSYLVLSLYGNDATIKSITVKNRAERDNYIAGTLAVGLNIQNGEISLTETSAGTHSSEITLDCGDGVKLGKTADTAVEFWFVLSPLSGVGNGIDVTIESTDGKTATLSTSNSIKFSRNNVVKMAPREVVFE